MANKHLETAMDQIVEDIDPSETSEWLEALDDVINLDGAARCKFLLTRLLQEAYAKGISCRAAMSTPYCNTISLERQPVYPGDLGMEQRLTALIRWNALAMVMRSNKKSTERGGHLGSDASAADLFEVGFNHFFRGNRLRIYTLGQQIWFSFSRILHPECMRAPSLKGD